MEKIYFTPGPSQIYPKLNTFMEEAFKKNIPSISHRGKEYMQIMKDVDAGLRLLLSIPSTHHIFFLSSSLESMERIISNIVRKTSFHFINGSFAQSFAAASKAQGKKAITHQFLPGERIPVDTISIPKAAELICMTQNETSNGSQIPMEDIYVIKKRYPQTPIALDIVSSAPYPTIDFTKIDCAFFSVQKGFGLPAGLSILIVNDALVRRSTKKGYHDFPSLVSKSIICQTPETPNVLTIYLLKRVVEDMLKKGIKNIRKETEEKAKYIESVGNLSIENSCVRSKTVLVFKTNEKTEKIRKALLKKNIIVGKGYGKDRDTHIRIANFPQHTKSQVKRLVFELKKLMS